MSEQQGWELPAPPGWQRAGPPGRPSAGVRPLNVGDVLDGMFRLIIRHWRTYLGVAALILVPVNLVSAYLERDLVTQTGMLEMLTDPAAAQAAAAGGPAITGFLLSMVAGMLTWLLVTPLVTGVLSLVAARAYLGEPIGVGEALRAGFRRIFALIAAQLLATGAWVGAAGVLWLLTGLLLVVGAAGESLTAIVVAIVLGLVSVLVAVAVYVLFFLAPPAIMIEGRGPLAGLGRSFSLVRRHFWKTLGVGLLAWLITAVISMVLAGPFTIPVMLWGGLWVFVLSTAGAILSSLVTAPLLPNATTLLYFDARVRVEAFDIEAMAAALDHPGQAGHSGGSPSG